MAVKTHMRIAVLAMICSAIAVGSANAAGPQALSPSDAKKYAEAFDATARGDFIEAQMSTSDVKDKSLLGVLSFQQLMHPSAHTASFQELANWLSQYADLPSADRIFALASRRKPIGAEAPRRPLLAGIDWGQIGESANDFINRLPGSRGQAAKSAFYSGDVKRALALAPGAGDFWIAGMSAYRLKNPALAETYFVKVARDGREDPWLRAAGAYWAGRAASDMGDGAKAAGYLREAANFPDTFYGMIAERQGRMQSASARSGARQGDLVLTSYSGPDIDLTKFIKADPRAHRAAALSQIGRPVEAGLELRAGLALADTPAEKQQWTSLALALNPQAAAAARAGAPVRIAAELPVPPLEPKSGFTLDKALVYAIVRQESRFNPMALSRAAGDDKLKTDMSPLFDPAFNLRVGQDYLTWLMERGVGYDILRTVAAYNGGPATLIKTAQMLGDEADSLMVIECLPSLETRNYVEKVMAGYWTYRKMWGEDSPTLNAIAGGAQFIDARLDLGQASRAGAQVSSQPLQVGMR